MPPRLHQSIVNMQNKIGKHLNEESIEERKKTQFIDDDY